MAYGLISVGGVTMPYNANQSNNPVVQSVSRVQTLGGTVFTEYPVYQGDRTANMTWDMMDKATFDTLNGFKLAGGNYTFVDEYNNSFTVKIVKFECAQYLQGGEPFVQGVTLELWIISMP